MRSRAVTLGGTFATAARPLESQSRPQFRIPNLIGATQGTSYIHTLPSRTLKSERREALQEGETVWTLRVRMSLIS